MSTSPTLSGSWLQSCKQDCLFTNHSSFVCLYLAKLLCIFARLKRRWLALVGPSGLEPPTSCLSGTRSNLLSYEPMWLVWILFHTQDLPFQEVSLLTFLFKESKWWRWWDSNPWPPACRAGALPAELHPHLIGFCFFSVFSIIGVDFSTPWSCQHWAIFPYSRP